MKWILIAAFVTGHTMGGSKGFSFQEFDSKETCETAKQKATEMAAKVRGSADPGQFQLDCVKK